MSKRRRGDGSAKLASPAQRPDRFKKALERLARESGNLRLEQAALDACGEMGAIKNRFLIVAFGALLGDRLSRLVRIFEDSKDTASFWYLHRCDPTIEKKIDVQRLRLFIENQRCSQRDVHAYRQKVCLRSAKALPRNRINTE